MSLSMPTNTDVINNLLNVNNFVEGSRDYIAKGGLSIQTKSHADDAVKDLSIHGYDDPIYHIKPFDMRWEGAYSEWLRHPSAYESYMRDNWIYGRPRSYVNACTLITIFCNLYCKQTVMDEFSRNNQYESESECTYIGGAFGHTRILERYAKAFELKLVQIKAACREDYYKTIIDQRSPEHYLNLYHLGFYHKSNYFSQKAVPFFYYCKRQSKLDYKIVNR